MTKQRVRVNAEARARGRTYNLLFITVALLFIAFIAYQVLNQSNRTSLALSSNGETNAIPVGGSNTNAASPSASDTDITGLRAAEAGQLGEPALVWFHADW